MAFLVVLAIILIVLGLAFRAMFKPGGRGTASSIGPGAAGTIYDMLNEDKRKAIEIIVEGRAEARDPETADDIPPEEPPGR